MRFEFHQNGRYVGSAQWEGPGQVRLTVDDARDRGPLADYFAGEMTYMGSFFDEDEEALHSRRRDWTPWEFERACLAVPRAFGYRVERTPSEPVETRPPRHEAGVDGDRSSRAAAG
jgi:hypothetical protein